MSSPTKIVCLVADGVKAVASSVYEIISGSIKIINTDLED